MIKMKAMKHFSTWLLCGGLMVYGGLMQAQTQVQAKAEVRYRLDKISVPDGREIFDYFYQNDDVPVLIQASSGDMITNKDSLFYDRDGRMTQVRNYSINMNTNAFDLMRVEDYSYDANGRLHIRKERKSLATDVVEKTITYIYNDANQQPNEITYQSKDGYTMHHKHFYNGAGKLARINVFSQNDTDSPLVEAGRMVYEFDDNGDAVVLRDSVYLALQDKWVEMYTHLYTYDDKHNCTRWERKDFGVPKLANAFQYDDAVAVSSVIFPSYEDYFRPILPDFMANMRTKQTYFFNMGDGLTEVCDYNYFYAKIQTNGTAETLAEQGLTIYPRPASDFLRVEGAQLVSLTLYDAAGREVKSVALSGDMAVIGVATLPRGLYVAEVRSKTDVIRTKLLLQ